MLIKSVRISEDAHSKLKVMAAKNKRPIGAQMEMIIEAAAEDERDSGA